jgi:heme iron utilization protein
VHHRLSADTTKLPMDPDSAVLLRTLLRDVNIAALATLHKGEPAVSMVPFVHDPAHGALLIHVSGLATHTRDMQAHAGVSLLVTARDDGQTSPQALPRVAFTGEAQFIERDDPAYEAGRALYLQRFAQAAQMFALGDFSLVRIVPRAARIVGGFGRAASLVGAELDRALAA